MTVIYGDNGSGKSGYSRVLKRACRARDQLEPIHPNANLPGVRTGNAQASFDIAIDGTVKEVTWYQGKEAPPELSSFAIFDAHCARAYLDREDDFSYVPYGLGVFEALAKDCQQLKTSVEAICRKSRSIAVCHRHKKIEKRPNGRFLLFSWQITSHKLRPCIHHRPTLV